MLHYPPRDDKDLIYEGIATVFSLLFAPVVVDDKDLIYEGIATWYLMWSISIVG